MRERENKISKLRSKVDIASQQVVQCWSTDSWSHSRPSSSNRDEFGDDRRCHVDDEVTMSVLARRRLVVRRLDGPAALPHYYPHHRPHGHCRHRHRQRLYTRHYHSTRRPWPYSSSCCLLVKH